VTVRLLDPPLHEFLPRVDELRVKAASDDLSPDEEALLAAAQLWQEVNPMLGTRGVRLGVLKPGLYAMQVRALMDAVVADTEPVPPVPVCCAWTCQPLLNGAESSIATSWVLVSVLVQPPPPTTV
jgi:pyruvate,orthophosphate dikinase